MFTLKRHTKQGQKFSFKNRAIILSKLQFSESYRLGRECFFFIDFGGREGYNQ